MLLRFGASNHYSIRDYQEVSLIATKLKDHTSGLIEPDTSDATQHQDRIRCLPILALYGANASGKSSFIHALKFTTNFIQNSHTRTSSNEQTPYIPFALDEKSRGRASHYDIDIVQGNFRFHYGFEIDGKRVLKEWLYSFPILGQRQARSVLFYRDADEKDDPFYFGKGLRGENKQISKLVRPNSLFLSAAAQNAHPQLSQVFDYFENKIVVVGTKTEGPALSIQLANYFSNDDERRNTAIEFLKEADIGVSGFDFKTIKTNEEQRKFAAQLIDLLRSQLENLPPAPDMSEIPEAKLIHVGSDGSSYTIPMSDESSGTISLLSMLGPVLQCLNEGGTLVLDELNTTLHPLVSRKLLSMFSNPLTNPGKAQLICSTHDTNLLSGKLLRRDQIVLVEKDSEGATNVYSLSDIKVRASDNIERGYLMGRFGAIPAIGLPWSAEDTTQEE